MKCLVCGCNDFRNGQVSKTFEVDDKFYLVEEIPSDVCERCGEPLFSHEVIDRVRQMVRRPHQPVRTIEAEVLEYGAA